MFIKAVLVKNYQSLYQVGVSLGKFTVIYGESDVGKSAFYRAVRALITAEQGDSFISKGEKKVGVLLRMVSGHQVGWVKRKGKSCKYVLQSPDGQKEEWRRNRNAPVEILDLLKLRQVGVDGDNFYPNLRGQFDRLFLLFESSPKRARVLGSLISNILLQGIRRANIYRNRNEADIRALDNLREEFERKEKFDWDKYLVNMQGTLRVLERTQKAVEVYKKLEELQIERGLMIAASQVSVEFISKKFFMEIESLLEQYEVIKSYKEIKETLARMVQAEQLCRNEQDEFKEEMKKVKEKMKVNCPYCGKPISLLEFKNV